MTRPTEQRLEIPNNWDPRAYQLPLWMHMNRGEKMAGKRAAVVWHRRAGKDDVAMNLIANEAIETVGTYWHMLPKATQGRKVVWDSINKRGQRRIEQAFPMGIRAGQANSTEMKIPLVGGSFYQVVGSDRFEGLLGANPIGVVFSEWQRTNPAAWEYIRPILRENGGWAIFIFTPFGRNHAKRTYDTFKRLAETDDNYFAEIQNINDTGQLTEADIQKERDEDMSEALIQQEYYCSFTAPTEGAYYAKQLAKLEGAGYIGEFPYNPDLAVHTAWDIGYGDSTAIWFFQLQELSPIIHLIDYYQGEGEGLPHYARVLKARAVEKGYIYGQHIGPHDTEHGHFIVGQTVKARAKRYGINFSTNPRVDDKQETIENVRVVLPLCRFNKEATQVGLDALWTYHKKFNEKMRVWSEEPEHDWASDGADAFGEMAKHANKIRRRGQKPKPKGRPRAGDWMGS